MLKAAGYRVCAFDSAESFLKEQDAAVPGCLLLDISMPGMSGLELQRSLVGLPNARPIVFLTGMGDIPSSVQAMKEGAVDFLTKPVDHTRLFAAVDQAIRLDEAARSERAVRSMIERRLQALTRRERQVMKLVIGGHINKRIGEDMGIAEKTVKVHRMRVMKKMGVRSVAELVRLSASIGAEHEFSSIDAAASRSTKVANRGPRTDQSSNHRYDADLTYV